MAMRARGLRGLLVLGLAWLGRAQKGIGSLNDPCDCMQHHDFWMQTRMNLINIFFHPHFHPAMMDPGSQIFQSVHRQSCMYSPENEESHRPTALSDCIPGFLLVHIVCMQKLITDNKPERVVDYAVELMRLLPFGQGCIDDSDWPITTAQIFQYYRRVRRAHAAGPPPGQPWPRDLMKELVWSGPRDPRNVPPEEVEQFAAGVGSEAEVCPYHSLPDGGACWVLGPEGGDCAAACREVRLAYRPPAAWPDQPIVPRILALGAPLPEGMGIQGPWAPFECYVRGERRFHLAEPDPNEPGTWSYSVCSLACPCAPALDPAYLHVLLHIPEIPEEGLPQREPHEGLPPWPR